MDVYKQRERDYKAAVKEAIPVGCISSNHTFCVRRNVTGFREEDEALVKHGNKLFLVLGANQGLSLDLTGKYPNTNKEKIGLLDDCNCQLHLSIQGRAVGIAPLMPERCNLKGYLNLLV